MIKRLLKIANKFEHTIYAADNKAEENKQIQTAMNAAKEALKTIKGVFRYDPKNLQKFGTLMGQLDRTPPLQIDGMMGPKTIAMGNLFVQLYGAFRSVWNRLELNQTAKTDLHMLYFGLDKLNKAVHTLHNSALKTSGQEALKLFNGGIQHIKDMESKMQTWAQQSKSAPRANDIVEEAARAKKIIQDEQQTFQPLQPKKQ